MALAIGANGKGGESAIQKHCAPPHGAAVSLSANSVNMRSVIR